MICLFTIEKLGLVYPTQTWAIKHTLNTLRSCSPIGPVEFKWAYNGSVVDFANRFQSKRFNESGWYILDGEVRRFVFERLQADSLLNKKVDYETSSIIEDNLAQPPGGR